MYYLYQSLNEHNLNKYETYISYTKATNVKVYGY